MRYESINWYNFEEVKHFLSENALPVEYIRQRYSNKGSGVIPVYVEAGRKLYYRNIARRFIQGYHFKVVGINEKKDYYIWNGNSYQLYDLQELGLYLDELITESGMDNSLGLKPSEIHKLKTNVLALSRVLDYRDLANSSKNILAFKNGLLDVKTLVFSGFRPEVFIIDKIGYRYTQEHSETPNWDRLMEIVFGIDKVGIELSNLLMFYIGYMLSMDSTTNMQYFMILQGSGSNGKSFLLETIKKMIGEHNYTNKKLKDILDGELGGLAELENKLALIDDDESEEIFSKSTAILKELTGGSENITVRKLYTGNKKIECRAKVWIAMNPIPYTTDTSDGFKRRMLILPFRQKITASTPKIQDDGTKSVFIPEFPAIIRKCIQEYKRVCKEGKLRIPSIVEELRDRVFRKSNNVMMWFEDSLVYTGSKNDRISLELLLELYNNLYSSNKRFDKRRQNFYEEARLFVEAEREKWNSKSGKYTGAKGMFFGKFLDKENARVKNYLDLKNERVVTQDFMQHLEATLDFDEVSVIKRTKRERSRNFLEGYLFRDEYQYRNEAIPF